MSVTIIRRLIEILIGLFVIGIVLSALRGIASLVSGSFGRISWPIASDLPEPMTLASDGKLRWTHGDVILTGQPFGHAFDIVTTMVALVMMIVAFLSLRRVLLALTGGNTFTSENIADLRKIGWVLLGVCLISVIDAVVLQSLILSEAEMPAGLALHPSISWNLKGVENIWMDYSPPVGTFMLGALAFVTAAAFKSGMEYREDSESVV